MSLAALQREFQTAIVNDCAPTAGAREGGLAIYRNAYRARLLDCMRESYDRTWTWMGDEAFSAAACHHLILHPPGSWTLDDAGRGFDRTLATLFPEDPEASDLAWLERAMQDAFTANDTASLTAGEFGHLVADFGEDDWADLVLSFGPGLATRTMTTDCVALWKAVGGGELRGDWALDGSYEAIVWRTGTRPQCRLIGQIEAVCLRAARNGTRFGDLCGQLVIQLGERHGIKQAGTWLGEWITQGLVVSLSTQHADRASIEGKV